MTQRQITHEAVEADVVPAAVQRRATGVYVEPDVVPALVQRRVTEIIIEVDYVASTAPAATVILSNHTPQTNDTLTATATRSDPNGLPVTLTYVWTVDGVTKRTVVKGTGTGADLTDTFDLSVAGNGDRGDTVVVTVTPNNGIEDGTPASDTAVVADTPPSATVVLSDHAPPFETTLTGTATRTDPDAGDLVSLTWQWYVNGVLRQQRIKNTGTASDLTDTFALVSPTVFQGATILVKVTPFDGTALGGPASDSATVGPPAAPPPGADPPGAMIEIAFATDPDDPAPVWIDVTADFEGGLTINGGRQEEQGYTQASTLQLKLQNRDRKYDPENTASPYYPNVVPERRIRVTMTRGTVSRQIFNGQIDAWPISDPTPGQSLITLQASDAFARWANIPLDGSVTFPAEPAGARIAALLDLIGWPADRRDIDGGVSVLVEDAPTGNLADAIRQCADSDDGVVFISGDGKLTFRSRARLFTPPVNPPIFSDVLDDPVEIFYRRPGYQPSYDNKHLWPTVRVHYKGETAPVEVSDAAAVARYGHQVLETQELLLTELEATDRANALLARYKDPHYRLEAIMVDGRDDLLGRGWEQLMLRTLFDRIVARRRPVGGGSMVEKTVVIQGYSHTIEPPNVWQCTWRCGPDPAATTGLDASQWWRLEDPVQGQIDSIYKFAF